VRIKIVDRSRFEGGGFQLPHPFLGQSLAWHVDDPSNSVGNAIGNANAYYELNRVEMQ
jgi:hypothetical protein